MVVVRVTSSSVRVPTFFLTEGRKTTYRDWRWRGTTKGQKSQGESRVDAWKRSTQIVTDYYSYRP